MCMEVLDKPFGPRSCNGESIEFDEPGGSRPHVAVIAARFGQDRGEKRNPDVSSPWAFPEVVPPQRCREPAVGRRQRRSGPRGGASLMAAVSRHGRKRKRHSGER